MIGICIESGLTLDKTTCYRKAHSALCDVEQANDSWLTSYEELLVSVLKILNF